MIERPIRAAGKAILWQSFQMGGVKAIYMIRLLVLAILLTPSDFGIFAIATAATNFLMNLTNFGLIPALVQAKSLEEVKYDSVWTFDLTRSILITSLTIIFAPLIASIFAEPEAIPIIRALALRPLFESMISIKVTTLNRNLLFRPLAYLRIIEAIVNTITSIVLAKFVGVWALVFGSLSGAISMVVASYILAPHRPRISFNWKAIRPLMNFGGWILITGLLAMAVNYGLRIIISRQLGAEALGLYFIAAQLAFIPSELASEMVGTVAFPLFARLNNDIPQATRVFRALFSGLAAVIYPISMLIIVFAPTLTNDILGPNWAGTEMLIRILSMVVIIGIFGEVATTVFKGFGQPHKITILEIFQSSIILILVWILTSRFGLVGSALAWLPAILFSQLLCAHFLREILDHPFKGLHMPLMAILTGAGLCVLVATLVSNLIPGIVGLVIATALGGTSTIALLWTADRRYKLGFAHNIALLFPQFAGFLGFASIELEND